MLCVVRWMCVCCECCELSSGGLSVGPITSTKESYRVVCVCERERECVLERVCESVRQSEGERVRVCEREGLCEKLCV